MHVGAELEVQARVNLGSFTPDDVHRRSQAFNFRNDADPYRLMVESFADSVIHERPVAIPLAESIANMRVLDQIAESAAVEPDPRPAGGDSP